MAYVSLKAWRARSAERAEIATRLKQDLRLALRLGEGDTLAVHKTLELVESYEPVAVRVSLREASAEEVQQDIC